MTRRLHEIIAVSKDINAKANHAGDAVEDELKKLELFLAIDTSVKHIDEDAVKLDTTESKPMATTVNATLKKLVRPLVQGFDIYLLKERTNQNARADIIVDETVIAKDVPATVLLGLETKLAALRSVYNSIPTLASGIDWVKDETQDHVYKRKTPDERFRTKKDIRVISLAKATDKHAEQVTTVNEEKPIARVLTSTSSGMMTQTNKTTLLERLDQLIRAVKQARQRANMTEVVEAKIGQTLFDYIHNGIVT